MKQLFYKGELVTALPNDKYIKTDNGWTGRVISCDSGGSSLTFKVVAKDRRGYINRVRSWDVFKKFFILFQQEDSHLLGGR